MRPAICSWVLVLGFVVSAPALRAEIHTVCFFGCDFGSIAEAIECANDGDTLQLSATSYFEYGLAVDKSLTIQGRGPATVLDGLAMDRVLSVSLEHTLDLRDLTVRNGDAGRGGYGGGLLVGGTAYLTGVLIAGNRASDGAGIRSSPATRTRRRSATTT